MAYEYDRFDDETTGGGGFVMGLLAGALLGAGIGMLLAPKAGAELRGQIGDQASRLRERAVEGYNTASTKVRNMRGTSGTPGTVGTVGTVGTTGSYATAPGYSASGVTPGETRTEF